MKSKIIKNIMENSLIKYNKINKIFNINDNYDFKFNKINKNFYISLYKDNKLILIAEYNLYGIYQTDKNLWVWVTSLSGGNKNSIRFINKIRLFDYLFEFDNNKRSNLYYQLLTQDMIILKNKIELKWINELLLYLSNDLYYLNIHDSDSVIKVITLKKIKYIYI